MTINTIGQVEFNGLRLVGDYEIQGIDGLADYPEIRSADLALLARHGLHPGTDLLGGRTITITVAVNAEQVDDFATALGALRDAFVPAGDEQPLQFWLRGIAGSSVARVNCRPRRLGLPTTRDWNAGYAVADIQLFATDPLIYDDSLSSQQTTLPTSPAGLAWPLSWPLNWGGTSAAGSIFAINDGNFPSPATIRIDGPVTNPRVENLATGNTIELNMTIADGDYVMIDTGRRTVLLGGTASRYSSLTSDSAWWDVLPGVNEVTFRASTTTSATLTLEYRSAYA